MRTVYTRYSCTCDPHERPYTAETTGAIQQSGPCGRPTPRPLPSCLVPSDAHRARDLGPREALRPKRTRSRVRAPNLRPSHPMGGSRHQSENVARAPLGSLRRPPAANGCCSRPAKGVSMSCASAGRHGCKGLEQERAPDGMPQGAEGRRWQQERGDRERRRRGSGAHLTGDKPSLTVVRRDAKDPTTVAEQKVVLGHP